MSMQRKCLAASAITHGLLVVLLLVSSAFIPQPPKLEMPSFELITIPDMLVDSPNDVVGGGNPNASPVQSPPQIEPKPDPVPVQPPPQPEPVRQPEVPKPQPRVVEKPPEPVKRPEPKIDPNAIKISEKPANPPPRERPRPTFDLAKAKPMTITPSETGSRDRTSDSTASDQAKAAAQARARAGAVASAIQRVQGGLSQAGGSYDIPGPGGAAYASYHLAIRKIYEDAWIPPTASRASEPVVEAEVVIRKDGTVIRARIIKRTGRAELDRSVNEVLNRVKKVPPFPAGATDNERTFRINFNLTDKLAL